MSKLKLGSYVMYNTKYYLAVKYNPENKLVSILDIDTQAKLQVTKDKITILPMQAICVERTYGEQYLVTLKGLIISRKTNRVMRWDNNHGLRKQILRLANEARENRVVV